MRRLALAALLMTAAACGGGNDPAPAYSDPSRPIEVRAGGEFTLTLKSNQSTGYQWVLADSAALGTLQLVSKDYTVPREYRDSNGAGGAERWIFRAPSAGNATVSLIYKGPSEDTPPADSARFQVTVR